jgi:hypothetical protein
MELEYNTIQMKRKEECSMCARYPVSNRSVTAKASGYLSKENVLSGKAYFNLNFLKLPWRSPHIGR